MRLFTLIIFIGCLFKTYAFEKNSNVVIDESKETYSFIANKNGDGIDKVKVKTATTYKATISAGKALATAFYDDNISIDKASAPKAKARYRHWIPDDIFFTDSKVCYLEIPLKEKGATATAQFEWTYAQPQHFTTIIFPSVYPIRNKEVRIEVPTALSDKIRIINHDLPPSISLTKEQDSKDGDLIYTYHISDIRGLKLDKLAPDPQSTAPRISILSTFANHQELYSYLHSLTIGFDQASDSIKSLALQLTSNCSDDASRIKSITEWVQQNIRYIAIEHGIYGQRPDYASEVLRKRFGDCKGMSVLLKSLLRCIGVDARLVWIGTEDVGSNWEQVPSLASGNHMICAVVSENDTLYIDGTSRHLSIGCYHPALQGQQAMIEDGDTCALHSIPTLPPNVNTDSLSASLRIVDGKICGNMSRSFTGINRMGILNAYSDISPTRRNELLRRYLSYPKNDFEVSTISLSDSNSTTFVHADVSDTRSCQIVGTSTYIDCHPIMASELQPIDITDRQSDLLLPASCSYSSNISIDIPDGYIVEHLPEPFHFDNDDLDASIIYSVENSTIHCTASLRIKHRRIPLSILDERNQINRLIRQANSEQIILTNQTN